jgi:acetyl esterase/lipase
MYCGTNDILYPDCAIFYKKLKAQDVNIKFHIYHNEPHGFINTKSFAADKALYDIISIVQKGNIEYV